MRYLMSCGVLLLLLACSGSSVDVNQHPDPEDEATHFAGFRASRILSSYPNNTFPDQQYWQRAGETLAAPFNGYTPAGIWIVSLYQSNGETRLNFPALGASLPFVSFSSFDQNEAFLSHFDAVGLKVWLQVEPGAADIDSLIHLVMDRYGQHPSVIGFGVDVEWHNTQQVPNGRPVTDQEAARWEATLKALNPEHTLFLKHFGQNWMPPAYRGDILFVDDSQDFRSAANPFNAMVGEFASWGLRFSPNPVAFQYGYPNDRVWWSTLADPNREIGAALISLIPNCRGLFWVDFTLNEIVPVNP